MKWHWKSSIYLKFKIMAQKRDYEKESKIIQTMYKGEENRDASKSIRGFLFQDLIAVSNLTNIETKSVCLEYTEDITVITDKKTYIIQAKYYPQTSVKMPEVIRELYYQYLRLEILGYTAEVVPVLAIHTKTNPIKPLLVEIQAAKYININRIEKPEYPQDVGNWLEENIYKELKDEAQKKCFTKFAFLESMQKFLENFEIQSDYERGCNFFCV